MRVRVRMCESMCDRGRRGRYVVRRSSHSHSHSVVLVLCLLLDPGHVRGCGCVLGLHKDKDSVC